jgi:hypothetical protein
MPQNANTEPPVGFGNTISLGALHTMTEGREVVDFRQSNCKNPRVQLLHPFTLWPKSKDRGNLKWLLFKEGDGLSKEGWLGREWKPKLWSRGRRFLFMKKIQSLTRFWPLDWRGYFEQEIKWHAPLGIGLWGLAFGGFIQWLSKSRGHGSSWPKDLDFGGFTLCPAEGSTYYILLAIFNSFLWTLNKFWPLNSTASRLGRP